MLLSRKSLLLILTGLGLVGIILYIIFYIVLFRVVSISPDPSRFPTSSDRLSLTFTKELNSNKKPEIVSKDIAIASIEISHKTLTIQLKNPLAKGQLATISIKNATSTSMESLSQDIVLTGVYVDYANLPAQEQQKQIAESNSFSGYTLMDSLPLSTSEYEINFLYPNSNETKMPIYITVKNPYPTPDSATSAADRAAYNSFLKLAQEHAYAKLTTLKGYDETHYQIYYSEPLLGQGIKGSYQQTMTEY